MVLVAHLFWYEIFTITCHTTLFMLAFEKDLAAIFSASARHVLFSKYVLITNWNSVEGLLIPGSLEFQLPGFNPFGLKEESLMGHIITALDLWIQGLHSQTKPYFVTDYFLVFFKCSSFFFYKLQAWYGYGMAPWNKKLDFFDTHYMISLMVLTLVLPVFIFSYRHDHLKRHWRRREAMLLIIEREKAGIPYVDRNYVDPAKLELPTDEELNGAEVII